MKRAISLIAVLAVIAASVLTVSALGGTNNVQLVHTDFEDGIQTTTKYSSVSAALTDAVSGDVIEIFGSFSENSPIVLPQNLSITVASGNVRDEGMQFGSERFVFTDPNAETRTITKNFSGSMFVAESGSRVTFQNITLCGNTDTNKKGGILYLKNGAAAQFTEKVTLKNSVLTGDATLGGAVYAENGATLSVSGTLFSGNSAETGSDIYAESRSGLTVADGIEANIVCGDDLTAGDVTGDGKINVSDCVLLLKYVGKKKTLTASQLVAADITRDGKVDEDDAHAIARLAAGLK